ncbi:MAG: hypothetical protein ACE5JG_04850 [Planctomycetota bacterium]
MRRLSDPVVPLLGAAVSAVVVGAFLFVFLPRISRWLQGTPSRPSIPSVRPPDAPVGVWVSRSHPGCALLLEPLPPGLEAGNGHPRRDALQGVLRDGPYHLLLLTVCNFEGPEVLTVRLPPGGLAGAGGLRVVPVAQRLRPDVPPVLRVVLRALGDRSELVVPRRSGTRPRRPISPLEASSSSAARSAWSP